MQPSTIITGASRGIGACFAEAFAKRARPLILAARSQGDLDALANRLTETYHVAVSCVACNLATPAGVQVLTEACKGNNIDCLVNNAGVGMGGDFAEQSADAIDSMLFLNMQAVTRLTHAFLPSLKAHRGALINVASHAAFQPVPYMAAYAASKAYVLHFTEALHRELLPYGVRVQAFCPAATDTAFFEVAAIDVAKTRFKPGSIHEVVDASFKGLASNKAFVIPGLKNRLLTFSGRLVTRSMVAKVGQKLMGR